MSFKICRARECPTAFLAGRDQLVHFINGRWFTAPVAEGNHTVPLIRELSAKGLMRIGAVGSRGSCGQRSNRVGSKIEVVFVQAMVDRCGRRGWVSPDKYEIRHEWIDITRSTNRSIIEIGSRHLGKAMIDFAIAESAAGWVLTVRV